MKKIFLILTLLLAPFNSYAEDNFTLEDKIGQMIMVGFRGLTINNDSKISQLIKDNKIGGVIYFDYDLTNNNHVRNIESPKQLKKLSYDLKNIKTKLPIFIAIDQEGGKVQRLKEKYGFPNQISAEKLGKTNNPKITEWEAIKTVGTLNNMGINLNFAPVVDINTNPNNPAIGKLERSYSNNPETVYIHAKAAIEGYRSKNIITSLKHFPGHGSAFNDSHLGLTDITDTWDKVELIPYKNLIDDKIVDMIMMGHLFNKNIDNKYPSSISKEYTDIIRNDLVFDGVLISDDMQMKAIRDFYTLEEQVDLFLNTSMDIILYGNNLVYDEDIAEKVFNLILERAKNNTEIQTRIDKSFQRILKLKSRL